MGVEGREVTVATKILTAFDSPSRRRGLLGQSGLGDGEVLVIAPCSAVHTFRMQFPVDLIYARRDGVILKLRTAVPPNSMSGAWGAFAVIELTAGTIERTGLAVGDRLAFKSPAQG